MKEAEYISSSVQALWKCNGEIKELEASCCMSQRSAHMQRAYQGFEEAAHILEHAEQQHETARRIIEKVGALGERIGYLYATCCTPIREPHYQSIFKQLNIVHSNMWAILGHSHA